MEAKSKLILKRKTNLLGCDNSKRRMSLRKYIAVSKENECNRLDINQVTKCVFLAALCLKPVPHIFKTALKTDYIKVENEQMNTQEIDKYIEKSDAANKIKRNKKLQDKAKKTPLREKNQTKNKDNLIIDNLLIKKESDGEGTVEETVGKTQTKRKTEEEFEPNNEEKSDHDIIIIDDIEEVKMEVDPKPDLDMEQKIDCDLTDPNIICQETQTLMEHEKFIVELLETVVDIPTIDELSSGETASPRNDFINSVVEDIPQETALPITRPETTEAALLVMESASKTVEASRSQSTKSITWPGIEATAATLPVSKATEAILPVTYATSVAAMVTQVSPAASVDSNSLPVNVVSKIVPLSSATADLSLHSLNTEGIVLKQEKPNDDPSLSPTQESPNRVLFHLNDIKVEKNIFNNEVYILSDRNQDFSGYAQVELLEEEEEAEEEDRDTMTPVLLQYGNNQEKKYRKRTPQCKICSQNFSSYMKLKKHKLEHNGDKPYLCLKCGTNHATLEQLIAHLRIHQGKHPYVCKKCGKGFKSYKSLEKHEPVHVLRKLVYTKKMFKCEVCLKEFRKLCELERHTRVHTGEKPSVCNICNRRFQQTHNLNKHLLIHTQEKPFVCEICNKKFGRNDVLSRHLLTHAVDKPNHCEFCLKSFIRVSQLIGHKAKYHANEVFKQHADDAVVY